MNDVTLHAFLDEMEKIAFLQNVGTKIVQTLRPAAKAAGEYMKKGWNTGGGGTGKLKGWMGAGYEGGGLLDKATSLGGLTKHLPVGPKAMTVGFGAIGAKDALKKEDESGQGRSRAERMGSVIGGTAAGIAGGAMGLPGAIATGVAGDIVGGKIGKLVGGKRKPPVAPQPAPNAPTAPTNG
jgi:hypothetical protein